MSNGWIGVDLDGTLAHYESGDFHPRKIGAPVPPMVERVKRWLVAGLEVKIFTARIGTPDIAERLIVIHIIHEWCVEHIGVPLAVTNVKDYEMLELWDDRAVQVIPNTGEPIGKSTRGFE